MANLQQQSQTDRANSNLKLENPKGGIPKKKGAHKPRSRVWLASCPLKLHPTLPHGGSRRSKPVKAPNNAAPEPPGEAVAVIDAMKSHQSFRSLVFQVESKSGKPEDGLVLKARVQFSIQQRESQIKSQVLNAAQPGSGAVVNMADCQWAPSEAATHDRRSVLNALKDFKAGLPERVLDKFCMPSLNRVQGPWHCQAARGGVLKLIEVLGEPLGEDEDVEEAQEELTKKEKLLIQAKQLIEHGGGRLVGCCGTGLHCRHALMWLFSQTILFCRRIDAGSQGLGLRLLHGQQNGPLV
jgi:hypothetical protein